jgi:hypothetical protein
LQGFSSVGRASVSKTEGQEFESLSPCQFEFIKHYRYLFLTEIF